ncbi:MAG TPA: rRNA maturation RNase YbeY [Bryobacteraceae bacterium]|jgi:probable rRNA maturation factor|nr:rRNA maturation RNase YbeY [Bryobacteraceae bacterium]
MSSPEGSSILFRSNAADVRPRALQLYARKLQTEVAKGRAFECLITGDAELRKLNREFRAKDQPTDVLSFPSGKEAGRSQPLGSIAISLGRARAQARAFSHSTETEVRILMLHGLLHLLGYDHESDSGRMARAEKRWRERLGLPNGLIERVQT